jgi:hypothetical protein
MNNLARTVTRSFQKWCVSIVMVGMGLGAMLCCSSVLAQSGAGSIQGTVTDPMGAVIPVASIHVINQGTAVTADTKSNDVGFYQVPNLFTGMYVVSVTAPGMKTYTTSIELLVDQTAVINPMLTPGAVTERVEVAADMVQLTTISNGTISSTLENNRINQLPINVSFRQACVIYPLHS